MPKHPLIPSADLADMREAGVVVASPVKTKSRKLWLYWWWKVDQHGEMLRTNYSSRRKTNKEVQAYDVENGWTVGRVHRQRVEMEQPPKRHD